jgi:hypothetical protein
VIDRNRSYQLIAFFAVSALSGSILTGTIGVAQAFLIPQEQHWKYHIDRWIWNADRHRTIGIINPQIVIQNETADRLEGYIADVNGTRLDFYAGEQVVQVRYVSNSSIAIASPWEMAGRVHEGNFAIDIPQKYRGAEIAKIFIGNNQYTVDNGTPTTAQTEVFLNSAILNYKTNSTLDQMTQIQSTQVAGPKPVGSVYEGGSLIDWILSINGLLPI